MTARNLSLRALVAVFAVLAALALAATLPNAAFGADSTPEISAAAGADAGPTGNVADGPGNASDAPGNAPDGPGNAADGPGNPADAPGHAADGPGKSEDAGPSADGPGNSANAPGHADDAQGGAVVDQGASLSQEAGASASAEQRDVDNTSIAVHIDQPGDGTPVGQENRATADAAASTSAAVESAGQAKVQQDAQADASAAQSGVSNTSIVVRVGSPGDDHGVSQANLATGIASASATAGPGDAYGAEVARATATQEGATNTAVSVRVFSPGDDGPVDQINAALASTSTGGADGTENAGAQQDGVRNTSVSIRVESPGSSGPVAQQSESNAVVSAGDLGDRTAVNVTSDAVDTVLTVAVAGSNLERPGTAGLVIWEWTWTWQRDESEGLGDPTGIAVSSWDWNWDDTSTAASSRRGNVTSRTAGDDDVGLQAGSWEWSWQWTREGVQDWSWLWNRQETLSCSSCVWIWNWTWTWVGQPPLGTATAEPPRGVISDSAPAAGPPADVISDSAAPGQLNSVRATAEAAVTADAAQLTAQEGSGPGTQFVGQLIEIQQDAQARADARQTDVISISHGSGAPTQSNVVLGDASAVLDASALQDAEQVLAAADTAVADQWVGQQVDIAQSGSADATSSQGHTKLTGPGTHQAAGRAHADIESDISQHVFQDGLVDGGSNEQWAGQLALVEQVADATSAVVQTGTAPPRRTGATANASASVHDFALVEQASDQAAARGAGEGSQVVQQLVLVLQDGSAYATTVQQAGASVVPVATSEAQVGNRAAVSQAASQAAVGTSGVDQELVQQSIVVQFGAAVSISNGGIAGTATVFNCAISQQGAVQAIGAAAAPASAVDSSTFCSPAAPQTFAGDAPGPLGDTPAAQSGPVGATVPVTAISTNDEEPMIFRGGRGARAVGLHAAERGAPDWIAPVDRNGAPPVIGSPASNDKLSALHSTQARFDSRPGSDAGAGDAGREPLLPPAGGGPPTWVSALAAAVSGAGSSGIAAILLAFVLVPPLLLRTREASVVRRPTDVLAPIDVPV